MRLVSAIVLAAGCSGPATMATPDAPSPTDGTTPGAPGLYITWTTASTVPGTAATGITVDSITLRVRHLRAIGDSGGGDGRTEQESSTVQWSAGQSPAVVAFPDAPTGLYSKLSFELDGQVIQSSFDIRGTAVVDGQTKAFEIHDRDETHVNLDVERDLLPGGRVSLFVSLDLEAALAGIDFTKLSDDGSGGLELDTNDAQMSAFRSKLQQSFSTDDNPH